MRLRALATSLLAMFFIAGCASSVSPLYTRTDAVADPAVIGTWISTGQDNQDTVRVEKLKGESYQVTVHDPKSDDDTVYEAHLVNLGKASFADLLLTAYRHAGQDVDIPTGAVPLHQIVKYELAGDDLAVSSIDGDALDNASKQVGFPLQLRDTEKSGGSTVILSTTPELRRYFSAHPADIFGELEHLKRQR